ncbi:cold shock domain-containing protein [Actinospica durhamensis]|uniref:Cold shock domain-containing protein n=1 Tax=Actinospica durhamensis TaxID=1508375 RepID=A0A941ESE4_9ACTN|nr:cold shock domain-containing protein [Actinospica durhamensis]MBR7837197.1 cold shock domain-containing protein [Actinospica durhamensis]
MAEGTIKWFSVARKYGFIVPDGGGKDVFLHMSALVAAGIPYLEDGARVSFEFEPGAARLSAVNLALTAPSTPDPVAAEPAVAEPAVVEPVLPEHLVAAAAVGVTA